MCTRLYAFGYGEGDNALNIAKLNNGKLYLDSVNQSKYGLITRIWTDGRYQHEESLFDAARAMLAKLEEPQRSYQIGGVHAGALPNGRPATLCAWLIPRRGSTFIPGSCPFPKAIFLASASTLQLKIDNTQVGNYAGSIDSVDLVSYMKRENGGKVVRGWHEISITPNTLTRVECNLSVQLFANSRGGGQF